MLLLLAFNWINCVILKLSSLCALKGAVLMALSSIFLPPPHQQEFPPKLPSFCRWGGGGGRGVKELWRHTVCYYYFFFNSWYKQHTPWVLISFIKLYNNKKIYIIGVSHPLPAGIPAKTTKLSPAATPTRPLECYTAHKWVIMSYSSLNLAVYLWCFFRPRKWGLILPKGFSFQV